MTSNFKGLIAICIINILEANSFLFLFITRRIKASKCTLFPTGKVESLQTFHVWISYSKHEEHTAKLDTDMYARHWSLVLDSKMNGKEPQRLPEPRTLA